MTPGDGAIDFEQIVEFTREYLGAKTASLTTSTRLLEDLGLVGDDAEEYLLAFAKKFGVDLSDLEFDRYFPDEATATMHYTRAALASKDSNRWEISRRISAVEKIFWGLFCRKKGFQSLTLGELASFRS